MGGRGSTSRLKKENSKISRETGGVITSAKKTEINTTYMEAKGYSNAYYKDEVLEATADKNGNVTFSYARNGSFEKTAKTNRTNYVTFNIIAGAVNGKTFNINWEKVNSIQGVTYGLRDSAREAGLKWDSNDKKWIRK